MLSIRSDDQSGSNKSIHSIQCEHTCKYIYKYFI